MSRLAIIELFNDHLDFSAGHFTIFSERERENLHGHNYAVHVALTTQIEEEGLSFDYRFYRQKLLQLCEQLDKTVLLPTLNKYLIIDDKGNYWHAHFNKETLIFLKRDVTLLPITNSTIEELSNWFLQQLSTDIATLNAHRITKIEVKVFSGFQSALASLPF